MTKKLFLLLVGLACYSTLVAQINRYMIFYSDKDTTAFSNTDPSDYLSERAIQRRENQSIQITIEDFPVTKAYSDSLVHLGVDVYYHTKWMNGSLVQMNENLVSAVRYLDFVTKVEYIAPDSLLSHGKSAPVIPETFMEPPKESSSSRNQLEMLGADLYHQEGISGEGMRIGILDNGFVGVNQFKPFEHLFDDDKIIATKDFVLNKEDVYAYGSHGTKVLSCTGADYEDVLVGTAPDAEYVLCITEASKEYRIEEYNWLIAAEFADSIGVDVINSSLGYSTFDDPDMSYELSEMDGATTVVSRAADILASKGVVVVVSAGNEGRSTNGWRKITAPADAFDVLSIGSVNPDRKKTDFSSWGPTADGRIKPDVCAQGYRVALMDTDGTITTGNGTSFASPIMAGFAACVWQSNPEWDYLKVMDAIRLSGSLATMPDTARGYGIPHHDRILNGTTLAIDDILEAEVKVFPNPITGDFFNIDFRELNVENDFVLILHNAEGKKIMKERIRIDASNQFKVISMIDMPSGIYLLRIRSNNIDKEIKLIKK